MTLRVVRTTLGPVVLGSGQAWRRRGPASWDKARTAHPRAGWRSIHIDDVPANAVTACHAFEDDERLAASLPERDQA